MQKLGFIGLGAMGWPMAANLAKAGILSVVWNRTAEKAVRFGEEHNVTVAPSIQELAKRCSVIFSIVSKDQDVVEITHAILKIAQQKTIVVDCSTIAANTVVQLAHQCNEAGLFFLDAPVSGGIEGAKQGTLSMMVGGDKTALDAVTPILDIISKQVVWIGESGSGQNCKAVNQIAAAGINQAVTEALSFGVALGLDMKKVISVVSQGAADNWFLRHRGLSILEENFEHGFKLALHEKDLQICKKMIKEKFQTALPVVEMTLLHYQRLIQDGHGDEDISALYRLKKANFSSTQN